MLYGAISCGKQCPGGEQRSELSQTPREAFHGLPQQLSQYSRDDNADCYRNTQSQQ